MSSNHAHALRAKPRSARVLVVLILTALYMIAEVIGGIMSNSLALLADAGHMLTDVAALAISWFAFKLAQRPPTKKASYGYYRAEVIAALFNGLTLLIVAFFLIKEAIIRLLSPSPVDTGIMISIAAGGLLINIIGLFLLFRDKGHNLNLKSAWLHLLFDTLGSVGVVVSGFLIHAYSWTAADPIASICIAVMVFYSAAHLIAETLQVLMEHTPAHIDADAVIAAITAFPQALAVHDLHIWSIAPGKEALSAHVLVEADANYEKLQGAIHNCLVQQFGLQHATIQLERSCIHPDATCEKQF